MEKGHECCGNHEGSEHCCMDEMPEKKKKKAARPKAKPKTKASGKKKK